MCLIFLFLKSMRWNAMQYSLSFECLEIFKHRFSSYDFHKSLRNVIDVNESEHLDMIFKELIENVEQVEFTNQKQSDIRSFFRP